MPPTVCPSYPSLPPTLLPSLPSTRSHSLPPSLHLTLPPTSVRPSFCLSLHPSIPTSRAATRRVWSLASARYAGTPIDLSGCQPLRGALAPCRTRAKQRTTTHTRPSHGHPCSII